MTVAPQPSEHADWSALDAALIPLRQCRTIEEVTEQAATLALPACDATAVVLGHVVGPDWLPWLRAGDLEPPDRLDVVPSGPTPINTLPSVDQRAIRTHEAGRREGAAAGVPDVVAAAVVSAGAAKGLLYVVGPDLNPEIVAYYANALGAVLDLIRVRQRAERQHLVLHRLRGAVAEPLERPIELISGAAVPDTTRMPAAGPRTHATALRERLTDRQREVLDLMMAGLTNAEIAEQLVVALPTVKSHVRVLLRISGSVNRAEALARFAQTT